MMMYELLILCVILFSIGDGQHTQFQERIQIRENVEEFTENDKLYEPAQILRKRGRGQNCGPKESKLNLTWVPEKIVIGEEAAISLDMIALRDLDKGKADTTVYNGNDTKSVFFNVSFVKTCEEAKDDFTSLNCPIKRGDKIKIGYRKAMGQLPAGIFTVVVNIRNKTNQLFACFKMVMELVNNIH